MRAIPRLGVLLLPVLWANHRGLFVFLPGPGYTVSKNPGSLKWTSLGVIRTTGPGDIRISRCRILQGYLARRAQTVLLMQFGYMLEELTSLPNLEISFIQISKT